MIEKLLNIIFPKTCLKCGKQEGQYICSSCLCSLNHKIHLIKVKDELYDYLIYLFKYKNQARKDMINFKFNDKAYMAEYFIEFLSYNNELVEFLKKFDFIIPVPTTLDKKKLRGYNQTELLSESLSKKLDIAINKNILIKVKNNKTQSTLSREERKINIKNVFSINDQVIIKNRKIILVDDIFTTGSTINECSKILKENYVKEICVLIICKG